MPADTPSDLHTLFRNAFNAGDVEASIALYEPDAILVVDGNGVRGHENIREAFRSIFSGHGRMSVETLSVLESPAGLAVLHGRWVVEYDPGTGSELVTRGLSTEVVRRQPDGTWLFIIDNPYTPA